MDLNNHINTKLVINKNVVKISEALFKTNLEKIVKEIMEFLVLNFSDIINKNDDFKSKLSEILNHNFFNSGIRLESNFNDELKVDDSAFKTIELPKIFQYEKTVFKDKLNKLQENSSYLDFSSRSAGEIIDLITSSVEYYFLKGNLRKQLSSLIQNWLVEITRKTANTSTELLMPELEKSQSSIKQTIGSNTISENIASMNGQTASKSMVLTNGKPSSNLFKPDEEIIEYNNVAA